MAVALCEITMNNLLECIRLDVVEHPKRFAATSVLSLAEAKADGVSNPSAIRDGDRIRIHHVRLRAEGEPRPYQPLEGRRAMSGKRHGRAAMTEVIGRLRGLAEYRETRTSYSPDHAVAEKLHLDLGFERTGQIVDGEVVLRATGSA